MYLGQVVEMAPATTLSENASHPYSRLLWSAAAASASMRSKLGWARTAGPTNCYDYCADKADSVS
jgi:ABC-type dipeptide/oligopeptide/nickel transport system ATPase component